MLGVNWSETGRESEGMRDGRPILLAVPNRLGTIDGGDGVKLHPQFPFTFYVAKWEGERWLTTETGAMYGDPITVEPHEPVYFAEINSPA